MKARPKNKTLMQGSSKPLIEPRTNDTHPHMPTLQEWLDGTLVVDSKPSDKLLEAIDQLVRDEEGEYRISFTRQEMLDLYDVCSKHVKDYGVDANQLARDLLTQIENTL